MDGTLDMPFGDTRKWNAFYYRTRANVDYVHQFAKLDLNVAGNFGLSNFNYDLTDSKSRNSPPVTYTSE